MTLGHITCYKDVVLSQTLLAQVVFLSALFTLFAQTPPQDTTLTAPATKILRILAKQEQLCCYSINFVKPLYPKEARLAHIEGVVKLHLVFADDGSIVELQPVSGDPLLVDSAMKAVQQWRVSFGSVVGRPVEREIALSLTFSIEDPPKPAYLHRANGHVIRADTVREFEDRIEYTVGHQTHQLSPDSVTDINSCGRVTLLDKMKEGDCIPVGGPTFNIRAIPLLPSVKGKKPTDTRSWN
jgi:Gram-negative bacterial TonB protein C-terminal